MKREMCGSKRKFKTILQKILQLISTLMMMSHTLAWKIPTHTHYCKNMRSVENCMQLKTVIVSKV